MKTERTSTASLLNGNKVNNLERYMLLQIRWQRHISWDTMKTHVSQKRISATKLKGMEYWGLTDKFKIAVMKRFSKLQETLR